MQLKKMFAGLSRNKIIAGDRIRTCVATKALGVFLSPHLCAHYTYGATNLSLASLVEGDLARLTAPAPLHSIGSFAEIYKGLLADEIS